MKYFFAFLLFVSFNAFSEEYLEPERIEPPEFYKIEKVYSQYCEFFIDQYGKSYLDMYTLYGKKACYVEIKYVTHPNNCACKDYDKDPPVSNPLTGYMREYDRKSSS